ncbi:hypothetical protein H6G41_20310 [Tolypothrix sp. FACHB-123]|nr:hypothetical protein [Tolypothrix sp. FACHB-123]
MYRYYIKIIGIIDASKKVKKSTNADYKQELTHEHRLLNTEAPPDHSQVTSY